MRKIALAAAMIGVLVMPGFAQAPPAGTPIRIRGTIDKLDGQTLVVKSREGPVLTIALAPNFVVSGVIKKSMADIKPGDFVASTSVKGTDGKLHAVEVHILPDALRGVVPESQIPWDLVPNSLMTNAIASAITAAPGGGHILKVTCKGTEAEVNVGADVPVAGYVPGDASLLKPGAAVFIVALKKDDGTLTASRVTAEKDGVKPPL